MQGVAKDYKTKSFIIEKKLPKILGNNQHKAKTIVGYDGGYSSIKGLGSDKAYCIPSIIKPVKEFQSLDKLEPTDIILTNHLTGKMYLVGDLAYRQMKVLDIKQMNDEILYDRYWFQTETYQVLTAVGLGLGLPDNYDKTDIYIQTGLPCEYAARDTEWLTQILMKPYDFSLQVGDNEPKRFTFTPAGVFVIEQPQGTLFGIMHNSKGELLPHRRDLLKKNVVIHDVGFGTEDDFEIRSRAKGIHKTFSDTAMKAVFDRVLDEVNPQLPAPIQAFEIQRYLDSGIIKSFDRQKKCPVEIPIGTILDKHNKALNQKAVDRLMRLYDDFSDVDMLIVTGGTGESRMADIKAIFEGFGVEVVAGNENDDSLPFAFSNVLGYYMRAYNKLSREKGEK